MFQINAYPNSAQNHFHIHDFEIFRQVVKALEQ